MSILQRLTYNCKTAWNFSHVTDTWDHTEVHWVSIMNVISLAHAYNLESVLSWDKKYSKQDFTGLILMICGHWVQHCAISGDFWMCAGLSPSGQLFFSVIFLPRVCKTRFLMYTWEAFSLQRYMFYQHLFTFTRLQMANPLQVSIQNRIILGIWYAEFKATSYHWKSIQGAFLFI
jgi:hypothetical protein